MRNIYFVLFFLSMIGMTSALSLSVYVPEKYTDVVAGKRLYFEIDIRYFENPSRKDLRLEYEVLTEDGDLISQSKALKAIEKQASFVDFLVIPESAERGVHIIKVNVKDYEDLSEVASSSFHVKDSGDEQIIIYLIIILGAVVFVGILVVFSIFLRGWV